MRHSLRAKYSRRLFSSFSLFAFFIFSDPFPLLSRSSLLVCSCIVFSVFCWVVIVLSAYLSVYQLPVSSRKCLRCFYICLCSLPLSISFYLISICFLLFFTLVPIFSFSVLAKISPRLLPLKAYSAESSSYVFRLFRPCVTLLHNHLIHKTSRTQSCRFLLVSESEVLGSFFYRFQLHFSSSCFSIKWYGCGLYHGSFTSLFHP